MKKIKKWMSKSYKKVWSLAAAFALVVTTLAANSTCFWTFYQDELPKDYKKLRKF